MTISRATRRGSQSTQDFRNIALASSFLLVAMTAAYRAIGLPPVVIVGGSSVVAFLMWRRTYLRRPVEPAVILPLFLLTVAALDVHMAEEYLTASGRR